MKKIYLAQEEYEQYLYLDRTSYHQTTCLVWADSLDEAELKVKNKMEINDPYGRSVTVSSVGLLEAIE